MDIPLRGRGLWPIPEPTTRDALASFLENSHAFIYSLCWRNSLTSLMSGRTHLAPQTPVSLCHLQVLWIISFEWLRWTLILVAILISGSVLVLTFWPVVREDTKLMAVATIATIVALHTLLAIGCKVSELPMCQLFPFNNNQKLRWLFFFSSFISALLLPGSHSYTSTASNNPSSSHKSDYPTALTCGVGGDMKDAVFGIISTYKTTYWRAVRGRDWLLPLCEFKNRPPDEVLDGLLLI